MPNSSEQDFDWIPFYEELADALVLWRDRQAELITFLEDLRSQGLVITPLSDTDNSGKSFLLTEIDPFTFFGVFNRALTVDSRTKILDNIKVKFSLTSEVPKNFAGIPSLNNQNSWFFAYTKDRKPEDISKLWDVFSEALKPSPLSSDAFEKAFDNALTVKYTSINLTFGLFWIRPKIFLNLDKNIKQYLDINPSTSFSFKEYLSIIQEVRIKHTDFVKLSYKAYMTSKVSAPVEGKDFMVSLDELINQCLLLRSKMGLKYIAASPVVEFTNTGGKAFHITLRALHQTLIDIRSNITEFSKCAIYNESKWRTLCATYFTDKSTNALSTVQSLPLYITISKLLHTVNNLPASSYRDSKMDFNPDFFDKAIEFIGSEIPDELMLAKLKKIPKSSLASNGVNKIYYGAPGTGKSYSIDQVIDQDRSTRIVFHADTQYSDFVGCLKPTVTEKGLTYVFRPGPFTLALVQAFKDPGNHYWLVIEEINRAPAAAVFGEIFQLLDRDEAGNSIYSITPSDPDMVAYIESALGEKLGNGQVYIPGNLSLLATMNSSDQAVMPLDTAFKRRWKFKYIPLEFTNCATGALRINLQTSGEVEIPWSVFAQTVNRILSELEIPEDRHLGPFFLSDYELKDAESQSESLTGKLFMYLWDDVLRHGYRSELFRSDIRTYGKLSSSYLKNELVFSDSLNSALESTISSSKDVVEFGPES